MNIINRQTAQNDVDPFSTSDRKPLGRNAGKGDWDRSIPVIFHKNFPAKMGPKGPKRTGRVRITYRDGKKIEQRLV